MYLRASVCVCVCVCVCVHVRLLWFISRTCLHAYSEFTFLAFVTPPSFFDAQAEWVSFAFECVFVTLFLAEMLVKMVALGACDIA